MRITKGFTPMAAGAYMMFASSCLDENKLDHVTLTCEGNVAFTGLVEYAYIHRPASKSQKSLVIKFLEKEDEESFKANDGYEWTHVRDTVHKSSLQTAPIIKP
ncbi:MAG: hypothetical protein KDJ35_07090 [Alphaproteobacteria bacterium]|nr:hypothetical protein [Alphaproteobacteria bacterium]